MFSPALLPLPTNRLALVQVAASRGAVQAAGQAVFDLAARLSLSGPLRVIDAGGLFDVCALARSVRLRTDSPTAVRQAVQSIRLTRAASCQQLLTALAGLPAAPLPTLVLDLLAPFYAATAAYTENTRLLSSCLAHLQRLSRAGPVVVTGQAPFVPDQPHLALLRALRSAAACVLEVRRELPA